MKFLRKLLNINKLLADFGVSDSIGKANQSIGTPLWMVYQLSI